MSKLDQYYRKFILGRLYQKGWGSFKELFKIVEYRRKWVGKKETCLNLVNSDYPIEIEKEYKFKDHTIYDCSFLSPFTQCISDLMPPEIHKAKFQFIVPKDFKSSNKPVVLHYGGTGDQYYWRRRALVAKPLLNEYSYASIILENPYYGYRKPKEQDRTNLLHVKDLFIMGGCLMTETIALLKWCEKLGYGPFALTGLSMGGHMASLGATVWPKPVALVPCLSWTSASGVFTRGVMSCAINWKLLEQQYFADKQYKKLKEYLKEMNFHFNEKLPVDERLLFADNSTKNFEQLTSFNKLASKDHVSMEIIEFMHLLMDECTHMVNFDVPCDTSLVRVLAAKDDAYVLRDGLADFRTIWPGSQVEFFDQGHVSAFLLLQQKYRKTIRETLNKLINKYQTSNLILNNS